ncbi:MAG: hypothetical protein ACU833_10710 [Gammaproteobacteria bacterium]
MKKTALVFLICAASASGRLDAEHQQAEISIYRDKSRRTVENLNQATEVLRDPTRINESFHDALKRVSPEAGSTTDIGSVRPGLTLSALVAGPEGGYAAMLKIDDQVRLVKTGDRLSIVVKNHLIEIVIDAVTRNELRLTVYPANETITLR